MKNFDDLETIKKLDPQNTLESIEMFLEQCENAWKEVNEIKVNEDFSNIQNIVFCGMGGSIYYALILKALMGSSMLYPTEIVSDYHLPGYANEKTLVVLISYSGTTEETLSCAQEAKQKGAKMIAIARGAKLADFAKENNIVSYIFNEAYNPSRVPRLGGGYTILGSIGLLNKINVINVDGKEIDNAIENLKVQQKKIKLKAMEDYKQFINKIPIIFGGDHLSGNIHILRNQFNETSKTFSAYYLLPDLNHHLLEGLQFPQTDILQFLILNSSLYSNKIKKRTELTINVVKQNKRSVFEYKTSGQNIYQDFLEVILYGSYLTLFLAFYYNQNPAINPWVDYFKEKLAQR